ncbi:MAG TPA: ATP-binding cassette domain-containing protein [Myxococcota bacterium]|nr:ATP-binding cassette domain-containing protein [Myxococcota bacterium]
MARVALRDIRKRFGATEALRGASLSLEPGSIHALLGENGAGKTTLVRTLYGSVRPDAGEIRIDDVPVAIDGPRRALALGIALVPQHSMLVPALSVAENLLLGEPGAAWLSRERLHARARELLAGSAQGIDLDARAESLSVGELQRLEIARALARGARVLVLDEPTAVLAPSEVDALLRHLVELRARGMSIVLISHKLEEISAVADQVTVLRAGETVASQALAGMSAAELGRLMVGDALPPAGQPPESRPGPPALRLLGVTAPGLHGIDLEVEAGEIVALAGIDGNGQQPLEELFAGVRTPEAGALEVLHAPLALLSGDRQRTGLVLELSVAENLVLPEAAQGGAPPVFHAGLVSPGELAAAAEAAIARFAIRARPSDPARRLSGGNQQKLCVARALRRDPGVLVAVNPTRGLDLAATAAVREELRAQARAAAAVLVISTELDEVLELGQRIFVLFRGRLLPVPDGEHTRAAIGRRMLGEAPG